jgi:hypothetical protein
VAQEEQEVIQARLVALVILEILDQLETQALQVMGAAMETLVLAAVMALAQTQAAVVVLAIQEQMAILVQLVLQAIQV